MTPRCKPCHHHQDTYSHQRIVASNHGCFSRSSEQRARRCTPRDTAPCPYIKDRMCCYTSRGERCSTASSRPPAARSQSRCLRLLSHCRFTSNQRRPHNLQLQLLLLPCCWHKALPSLKTTTQTPSRGFVLATQQLSFAEHQGSHDKPRTEAISEHACPNQVG